jgi:hypothetical protein
MAKQDEDLIEVTEENFGDLLIQGLEDVRSIQLGETEPASRVRRGCRVEPCAREIEPDGDDHRHPGTEATSLETSSER